MITFVNVFSPQVRKKKKKKFASQLDCSNKWNWLFLFSPQDAAQLAGAVVYTDCFSAKG